jgi:hypothetical protein
MGEGMGMERCSWVVGWVIRLLLLFTFEERLRRISKDLQGGAWYATSRACSRLFFFLFRDWDDITGEIYLWGGGGYQKWTALRSLSTMHILAGIYTYGDRMPCSLIKYIYRILEVWIFCLGKKIQVDRRWDLQIWNGLGDELYDRGEIIDWRWWIGPRRVWGIESFSCGEIFGLIGDRRWVVNGFRNFSCLIGFGHLVRWGMKGYNCEYN